MERQQLAGDKDGWELMTDSSLCLVPFTINVMLYCTISEISTKATIANKGCLDIYPQLSMRVQVP